MTADDVGNAALFSHILHVPPCPFFCLAAAVRNSHAHTIWLSHIQKTTASSWRARWKILRSPKGATSFPAQCGRSSDRVTPATLERQGIGGPYLGWPRDWFHSSTPELKMFVFWLSLSLPFSTWDPYPVGSEVDLQFSLHPCASSRNHLRTAYTGSVVQLHE